VLAWLVLVCAQDGAGDALAPGPAEEKARADEGVEAQEPSRWIDPEDGWFDVSDFLEQPHGFLPLIVPITEPALGYGAVGAAVFLQPREEAGAEGWARPNITAVGGLWTEDGSDGVFAGNSSIWSGGDVHTLVGGGSLGLELEFHGVGDDALLGDDPLAFQLDLWGARAEARWRLEDSDFWLMGRFAFADCEVTFHGAPGALVEDDEITLSGPGLGVRYDSLNNLFTPTHGTLSETTANVFDDAFGGSRDFQSLQQVLIRYWELHERLFLGARADAQFSFGDTPFYALPYIQLRGIPALRYQGEEVVDLELELRWQFYERFSVVAFGGAGMAWVDLEEFESEESAFSEGLGVRYELARKFGLHAGLDVARGPEENAIYLQFGSAWVRP